METAIRLHLSELTEATIARIKEMIGVVSGHSDPEIVISLSQDVDKSKYFEKLDKSLHQAKEGNVVSFTMEELAEYIRKETV